MTDVVVVGTGDHARVVADLVRACRLAPIGFVSPRQGTTETLAPILGDLEADLRWATQASSIRYVVAIGNNSMRRAAFERCRALGLDPVTLVHPSAVVLGGADVEPGSQVCALAMIGVDARIGENVIVNSAASVDHDCVVESHAFIGPGARLAGRVRVETGAHVGIGAVVREGTIIGRDALVAAGAVVVADVPKGSRVAGVPARPMQRRLTEDEQ